MKKQCGKCAFFYLGQCMAPVPLPLELYLRGIILNVSMDADAKDCDLFKADKKTAGAKKKPRVDRLKISKKPKVKKCLKQKR